MCKQPILNDGNVSIHIVNVLLNLIFFYFCNNFVK